jgi:hypothetical protein
VGNRAAFVDAVGRIVHDGELRERLTQAARNRTLPSAEELASRIGKIYERVIAGRER